MVGDVFTFAVMLVNSTAASVVREFRAISFDFSFFYLFFFTFLCVPLTSVS